MTNVIKHIGLIFLGLIGIIMILKLINEEHTYNKIRISNIDIIGYVVDVEEHSNSESGINYNIVVKYTINNIDYLVSDRYNMPYIKYNQGEKVEILFETSNPSNAIFKEDLNSRVIILEFFISLVLITFLPIGIYQIRKSLKNL